MDDGVNSYLIMNQEGSMDISSGQAVEQPTGYGDDYDYNYVAKTETSDADDAPSNGGRSKRPLVFGVVAVLAAAVIAAGGFAAYNYFQERNAEEENSGVFTFSDHSVVSGIDISGKSVSQAKKLLEQNADKFITPVSLEIDVNGEKTELRENNFTYTYNIDEVLRKMKSNAVTNSETGETYSITATVTDDSIKKNVEKICEERNCAPKNARVAAFHPYESKRFEFEGAKYGITVNAKNLNAQIKESFEQGNTERKITADVEKKVADMSMGELEDKLVKLASYETYSTNTANGTSNMRVALEACNGSVIEPGETWSFNESTGDSNKESNGYKSASVILEGKLTEGIGGGICQASSTIYNAAVRANMKIVERYNHKWASGYVPTGLDATIDYPTIRTARRSTARSFRSPPTIPNTALYSPSPTTIRRRRTPMWTTSATETHRLGITRAVQAAIRMMTAATAATRTATRAAAAAASRRSPKAARPRVSRKAPQAAPRAASFPLSRRIRAAVPLKRAAPRAAAAARTNKHKNKAE